MVSKTSVFIVLLLLLSACASQGVRRFPLQEPMWADPDMRPFGPQIEEYYSPFAWDGADQILFRRFSELMALDVGRDAINVNAWDEVPNSSWFTNRIGKEMPFDDFIAGPCKGHPPLDPRGPWEVVGAKPNGANPGFIIKDQLGRRFMLKFDGTYGQQERATSADVIGSYIYHAFGFWTPCNSVVGFNPEILTIKPGAKSKDSKGNTILLTMEGINKVLEKGLRFEDGTIRASSSLFFEGSPVGPMQYQGVRDDDPNDVIPHQDRRELRGAYVPAAWINHFDSREQNTLAMWIPVSEEKGYVRHGILDFGDCFGSLWDWDGISRRLGSAHYFDLKYVTLDFLTLGIFRRPWDKAKYGKTGKILGYFDVERLEADNWRPGYPNPPFERRTEQDAAWGARILARFSDRHIEALLDKAKISSELLRDELRRILVGRRDRLLQRFLTKLSPLAWPQVVKGHKTAELCLEDLGVVGRVVAPDKRLYNAHLWTGEHLDQKSSAYVHTVNKKQVCVGLPSTTSASRIEPEYLIVDVTAATTTDAPAFPTRIHLYQLGAQTFRVVGIERPESHDPPGS